MLRHISILITVVLFVGCAQQPKAPMTASTLPLDYEYTQDFSSAQSWNVEHDGVKLHWSAGVEHAPLAGCDGRGAMRIVKSGGEAIVVISIGEQAYTNGSIKLRYYHLHIDRDPENSADSKLLVRTSPDEDANASATNGMYNTLADLNATTEPKPPTCTPVEASFKINPGDKTIYIKLQRGSYPRALIVDDLKIKLVAKEAMTEKK